MTLTPEEYDNIHHAVHRGVQESFLTDDGDPLWEGLVGRGLACKHGTINDGRDRYYGVTGAGREAMKEYQR